MSPNGRDDLNEGIREVFDAPPGAVERVLEGAFAKRTRSDTARRLSIGAAVLAVTAAAVGYWLRPPPSHGVAPEGELRLFAIGDLTVAVEPDGTSWVSGPGASSTDNDHIDFIIVGGQEP